MCLFDQQPSPDAALLAGLPPGVGFHYRYTWLETLCYFLQDLLVKIIPPVGKIAEHLYGATVDLLVSVAAYTV
jgi:hypothetical protein